MQKPLISAIAAIGENRELGKGNELIWRVPADLKRVKALTVGHPIIMGRNTYESIGHPLPERTNIVVSRTATDIAGCVVVQSLDEALAHASTIEKEEIFIFGGASLYAVALPHIGRLYLTLIHAKAPTADVFFPEYEKEFTNVLEKEKHETAEGLVYEWMTLERV